MTETYRDLENPETVGMCEIILRGEKRRIALIDAGDYEEVSKYKWFFTGHRYAARHIKVNGRRKYEYMHRFLLKPKAGFETDHINGDGLDNRRANLRVCTVSQNQANRPPPKNNVSGVKGVSYVKTRTRKAKWLAGIEVNGKAINLGWFRTKESAAKARKIAEEKYFGEFNHRPPTYGDLERRYDAAIPQAALDSVRYGSAPAAEIVRVEDSLHFFKGECRRMLRSARKWLLRGNVEMHDRNRTDAQLYLDEWKALRAALNDLRGTGAAVKGAKRFFDALYPKEPDDG